jgi:hypothetical protein
MNADIREPLHYSSRYSRRICVHLRSGVSGSFLLLARIGEQVLDQRGDQENDDDPDGD